ncbi:jg81, partial [Pararge aegeria aegeria]
CGMDKENGEGDAAAKQPTDGLLDPSGLFGGV